MEQVAHIINPIITVINVVLGVLLTLGIMFMQSKSEGLGGVLGGASNISSRGIKGIDEQYRGMIKNIAYAWLVTVAIAAFFSTWS